MTDNSVSLLSSSSAERSTAAAAAAFQSVFNLLPSGNSCLIASDDIHYSQTTLWQLASVVRSLSPVKSCVNHPAGWKAWSSFTSNRRPSSRIYQSFIISVRSANIVPPPGGRGIALSNPRPVTALWKPHQSSVSNWRPSYAIQIQTRERRSRE